MRVRFGSSSTSRARFGPPGAWRARCTCTEGEKGETSGFPRLGKTYEADTERVLPRRGWRWCGIGWCGSGRSGTCWRLPRRHRRVPLRAELDTARAFARVRQRLGWTPCAKAESKRITSAVGESDAQPGRLGGGWVLDCRGGGRSSSWRPGGDSRPIRAARSRDASWAPSRARRARPPRREATAESASSAWPAPPCRP